MEPFKDCLSCNELNKCLQIEKKKVSQKNRLISLLKELVKSYEAKDLNLTFNDLSQIYESSANEVSILKQRLSLYLDENQELLESKNELVSQTECLEKKCQDIEVELSHLRFVNKQLGDYYREKEADHNQYKDRLKKLARKLLFYEPKNIEARKILDIQNLPIEFDSKPLKFGNKKKEEILIKDMEKEGIVNDCDIDHVKISDSSVLEEDEFMSSISGSVHDLTEENSFVNEGNEYTPSSVPVKDIPNDKVDDSSRANDNSLLVTNSVDNNISLETFIVVNTEESNELAKKHTNLSKCESSIDHYSSFEKMPSNNSKVEVIYEKKSVCINNDGNNAISSSLNCEPGKNENKPTNISRGSAFTRDCSDSNDSFEYENSLPDLISPLKSDESRFNGFMGCETIPNSVETENKEVNNGFDLERNYNESTDIKNEVFSNSSDPVGRSRKSSCPGVRPKYKTLNNGLIFNGKAVNGNYSHLTENYSTDCQFSSPQYISCCNNTCSKPPIFLKLYNCSNIEINIPSSVEKEGFPVIAVKDKKETDKSSFGDADLSCKPNIYCYRTSNSTKAMANNLTGYNNEPVLNVSDVNKVFFYENNHHKNFNGCSLSSEQKDDNKLRSSDFYFLDYLSKNESDIKCSKFGKCKESTNIKCNRIFPVKFDRPYDLDLFCLCFQSLKMNAFPTTNVEINTSLSSISKPPIFHNILSNDSMKSYEDNITNKRIFGQTLGTKNCTNKQEEHKELILKPSSFICDLNDKITKPNFNLFSKCGEDINKYPSNSITKDFRQDNCLKKNFLKESVSHNNYDKSFKRTEFGTTKRPFSSVGFEVIPEKRKKVLENKGTTMLQPVMTPFDENKLIDENLPKQHTFQKRNPQSPFKREKPLVVHKKDIISPLDCADKSKSIFDVDNDNSTDVSVSTLGDNILKKLNAFKSPFPSQIKSKFQSLNSERVCVESRPSALTNTPVKKNFSFGSETKGKDDSVINFKTPKPPLDFKKSKEVGIISKNINSKNGSDFKIIERKFEHTPYNDKANNTTQKGTYKNWKSEEKNPVNNVIKLSACNKSLVKLVNVGYDEKLSLSCNKEEVSNSKKTPDSCSSHDKKSYLLCNKEVESNCDDELLEIFKESLVEPVPLLSPLRRTPDLNTEEKSYHCEAIELFIAHEVDEELVRSNSNDKANVISTSDVNKCTEEEIESNKKVNFNDTNIKNENCINKKDSLSEPPEFKNYNIFSDEDERSKIVHCEIAPSGEEKSPLDKEEGKIDVSENEISLKFKTIRSYVKRNKISPDNEKNEINKSMSCNLTLEENITSVEQNKATVITCNTNLSPGSSIHIDKEERNNSGCDNSIRLGFYVNRSDIELDNNSGTTKSPELNDVDCSYVSKAGNNVTLDESCCHKYNNSEVNGDSETNMDMEKKDVSSLIEEQERPIKRKNIDDEEQLEELPCKKQKIIINNEHISCETDVFICALKYLSAIAVSTDEKKNCNQKPDHDANLLSKIAINHIKNLIFGLKDSADSSNYESINDTVKKILEVKEASAVTLAKSVIEAITESDEKEEVKTRGFIPSMTKTVKLCLLIAVSFIGYRRDFVMEFLEIFEMYISSFHDKSLTIKEGCRLVVFYTAFCRSYNLDYKVKYLIYDVLYSRNIKAYPMVFRIIQTWPDVMPDAQSFSSRECLLTQTIVYILLSGMSSIDEKLEAAYCIGSIRLYLQKHFGYNCIGLNKNELADKIIERITVRGGSLALVLLCKCELWEWGCNLIEKKLFPILRTYKTGQMDEITLCEYILTIGRIVRGFPITKAAYIVRNTLQIFETILLESNSIHLAEIIIEAISLLRRHNLMQCTSILMNWKPNNKQVTIKTINHIKTILMVKNVLHWKHVYLIKSAVPNHQNTRAIRSKRKP